MNKIIKTTLVKSKKYLLIRQSFSKIISGCAGKVEIESDEDTSFLMIINT